MFENHDVAMMLISPRSGKVVDANQAPVNFMLHIDQMRSQSAFLIDQFPPDVLQKEIQKAVKEEQTKFIQVHKLANGDFKTVEIHASPVRINNEELIFSIIFDVSDRKKAEEAVLDKNP